MNEKDAIDGIAIVGMAGRFPGAASVRELWDNLLAGREGITRFGPGELSPGLPAVQTRHSRYVPARGVLSDADRFDAGFFGIASREAVLIDPQQRVFLELAWNALEDAGIDPARFPGSIGVYAGTSNNTYRKLVESRADLLEAAGEFAAAIASEKDYVATRVAHRLDLTGPALSIHSACSTSLVAVAQAWWALMSYQCDLALAGGINIVVPQESGYVPVDGGIESEDGHCRPFDAAATGTVFSSGGGAVVLKRLADAVADGDAIYAVIRGVGVNNDGGDKASFGAPSVRGQAAVIRQALDSAGVSAASIGYVEGHGTATPLGDPIEVAALDRAFAEDGAAPGSCWLGSVKSNFGHLNAASGIAGLIKAALALHHERIPATLHYRTPNPQIDFSASAFRVADRQMAWPRGGEPRRAGVSSFGVGGTNAHVILEEAPPMPASGPGCRLNLLPLSARDEAALLRRADQLAVAMADDDVPALPDVAWTLAMGRQPMAARGFVVAANVHQASERLPRIAAHVAPAEPPSLVMLFPGQGAQHAGMARELAEHEPVFRHAFELGCALASSLLGEDLRAFILPTAEGEDEAARRLAETRFTQPALFVVEYALAELWAAWGLHPAVMIGHSIGEYVAACRAGVFSLEDALRLVVARGAAMFAQPSGAMLVVREDADALRARLPQGVEIVGCNAPTQTVLGGTDAAIEAFAATLAAEDVACTRLRVSHAFHSHLMEGALPLFRRAFDGVALHPPERIFYSCVSGLPVTVEQATTIDYWCQQLRAPVRFADAVRHVLEQGPALLLEAGPSQALSGLVRGMLDGRGTVVASLGPASRAGDAQEQVLRALGECWCAGLAPDWQAFYGAAPRRRVSLPGYPFHGKRYWVEPTAAASAAIDMTPAAAIMSAASPSPEETASMPSAAPSASTVPRPLRLAAELRELFGNLSGELLDARHDADSFLDLGFDSLSLTQAALAVEQRYGVKIKFRRLMEDVDSIGNLAGMLDATLPPDAKPAPAIAVAPAQGQQTQGTGASTPSTLAQLIQNQMALLQQQSVLLASLSGQLPGGQSAGSVPAAAPAPTAMTGDELAPANLKERPFGASARITTDRHGDFSPAQRAWLAAFTEAYCRRTRSSKDFAQQHRALMADPRVVTGFNPQWKELVYPITVERSLGARLWDLDGNAYIDLLNGFGVNFLGYQPAFVTAALHAQVDTGVESGPQHPLAAEVAQLISDMTGMARVGFCNTGSEAVMGAMRVARTVTGHKTIVVFRDSYHGIFDEVIVRGTRTLRSIAAAPGILANAVENVLVLDYGTDEALRIIGERGHELAAVLVEPVQSKHPELQPKAFLQSLRGLCDRAGCALIFDEIITGFRMAPGGAQEAFGVRADLATYGKIIGGGLPFAAIAGSAKWMDALDGGFWQFGDDSYPGAGVTYFAGTFVRHPLALAAAKAALQWIREQGPQLQASLNARTQDMVARLNALFDARQAPVTAVGYSSLWKLRVDDGQPFASLLWYRLRHAGLHVFEQFNCFLSVAHGDAEVECIVAAVTEAVDDLLAGGMLTPRHDAGALPVSTASTDVAVVTDAMPLPDKVPLTDAQMERWLGQHYSEAIVPVFNEASRLVFHGPLDAAALHRAFDHVVQRHDVLAMRFAEDGSGLIHQPPSPVHLDQLDLSGADAPQQALDAFIREQSGLPFLKLEPPLVRACLVTLAQDQHVLVIVSHHIVMDGWSLAVFVRELALGYNALRRGTTPTLPPASSWRSFVLEERSRRDGASGRESLAWWLARYRTLPDPLELPTDRPRGPLPSFDGATYAGRFDGELLQQLRRSAKAQRVTLFALLLAGFYALLQRLSGQHDLVCRVPFAGQATSAHGQSIGDSDNTLPIRVEVAAEETFASLVRQVQAALLDAGEHQDVSLGRIAGELGLTRNTVRQALSDVVFNFNPLTATARWDGLAVELQDQPKTHTGFDLAFHLSEQDGGLDFLLHYRTALFDAATIVRWCAYLAELLRHGGEHPQCPVARLPLLDAAGRRQVLEDWNRTDTDSDRSVSLVDLLARVADAQPSRLAVRCGESQLDYAGLDVATRTVALGLRRRGLGRGDRVGVCVPRSLDMLIAVTGVMRSGAAYVPLDPEFPATRLEYMATKAGLRQILVGSRDSMPAVLAEQAGVELLEVEPLRRELHDDGELPQVSGDDLAYVLFTSGSTGQPKGVRILHRNLVNFLRSMQREPGFGADDVLCAVTTLSFDIAGLELYLPLIAGGQVVIATEAEKRDPQALRDLVVRTGCTVLQGTPALLKLIDEASGDDVIARLRLLVGGEALPPALARVLASRCGGLWNLYGPTETTIWSTVMPIDVAISTVPLGRPIDNTRVYVLDRAGEPTPPGVIGEIVIAGDGVADGYLGEPELTADRFVPDRFRTGDARMYRTGDLGSWRDGVLYFHGRADHQIKIRGFRIEPGDIEAAAGTCPAVRECVVVAHRFGDNDLRLVLYVVSAGDAAPGEQPLREHLRERLPGYMLPQHIEWLEALPKTANGKLDRKALPPPQATVVLAAAPPQDVGGAGGFADPRQAYLAGIWREMIGGRPLCPSDNFFDAGGHSLLAVAFTTRVQHETGVRLDLYEVATATLAGLALRLPLPGQSDRKSRTWQRWMKSVLRLRGGEK